MRRVGDRLQQLERAPHVDLLILVVLAIHRFDLALRRRRRKERRDEELRKAIEDRFEVSVRDVEVVVRVLRRRVRVRRAAVFREELRVPILIRVALRAQEEHVLEEVRETGQVRRVVVVANVHVQRRRRLVRRRVADQQHRQSVRQSKCTVHAIIVQGLFHRQVKVKLRSDNKNTRRYEVEIEHSDVVAVPR